MLWYRFDYIHNNKFDVGVMNQMQGVSYLVYPLLFFGGNIAKDFSKNSKNNNNNLIYAEVTHVLQ